MFNYPIGNHQPKSKKPAPMPASPMTGAPEEGAMEEAEPSAIAQQHGPATQVNIEHEHEMGSHHVHSVHPDGHEHHSDHGSVEEAHEHGKKLAGAGGEEHGEPDGDEFAG